MSKMEEKEGDTVGADIDDGRPDGRKIRAIDPPKGDFCVTVARKA